MNLLVLHNDDGALKDGHAEDALAVGAVVETAAGVARAARSAGWIAQVAPASDDPTRFSRTVRDARPDVVFNLVESLRGEARFESAASAMLELLGVSFTGAGPRAQAIALEKPVARAVLLAAGIPVPAGKTLVRGDESLDGCAGPWIVKPAREDASHGISRSSVCATEEEVRERAAMVIRDYRQPAIVESFIDGREFNVAILGEGDELTVLPLAEIDFSNFPAGVPKIVTYEAKWVQSSEEYRGSTPRAPENLDPELAARIEDVARAAYRTIGLRDYGRIDMRIDPRLGPLVIDVNPNPDVSADAGLAKAAARHGITYKALIERIVRAAAARRVR